MFAVRFAITNEHRAVLDVDDARVGDGDFEDVGGEIFESSLGWGQACIDESSCKQG